MAANQTHLDIRYDLTNRIQTMLLERTSLATSATRYAALGTPSVAGDGGATCSGQLLDAVQALEEILDNTAGDPDFGGIAPSIVSFTPTNGTEAAPTDIGTDAAAASLRITVRHLLPFPKVAIRPVGAVDGSTDVDLTGFITGTTFSRATDSATGLTATLGVITIADVTAALFAAGQYTVRVSNPLDAGAAVAVSNALYLTATA